MLWECLYVYRAYDERLRSKAVKMSKVGCVCVGGW